MFRRITALMTAVSLILFSMAVAAAEGGLFGQLARDEDADERLALLEEVSVPVSLTIAVVNAGGTELEVSQAYYEGNRIYISYRMSGGEIPIHDGLLLEDGSYADIIFGDEAEQEDGSVIGWKECIVPDESAADNQTFSLAFGESYENRLSFNVSRNDYEQHLQGTSGTETSRAQAELYMGKVDLKGTVRLVSPEQAASWLAWQEGEDDESEADVIGCWNLYRNGELVSEDLFGASQVVGTDEILFDVMFPRLDDLSGLKLVPEYSEGGEKPEEAIALEPAVPQ